MKKFSASLHTRLHYFKMNPLFRLKAISKDEVSSRCFISNELKCNLQSVCVMKERSSVVECIIDECIQVVNTFLRDFLEGDFRVQNKSILWLKFICRVMRWNRFLKYVS